MRQILLALALLSSAWSAPLTGNKITADGTYTVTTTPGKRYVFSASGTFGSGSLAINWTDSAGTSTAFANSPATAAETWTFTAPTSTVSLVLSGSTNPSITVGITPAGNSIDVDISELSQSGATSGQVPTWNGSAWAAANKTMTNVKDFGATGDGVTNDTAAINLAKTAALASNHTLYFPPGTYLCNLELTTGQVLNFVGAGADSVSAWTATSDAVSTLKPYSNASPVIWLNYLSANCLIEGLNILGNGAGTSEDGIKFNAVGDGYPGGGLLIRQCTVRGFTNAFTNLGGTPVVCETSAFLNSNKCVYSKGEGLTRTMRFDSCVFGGAVASGTGQTLVNEGVLYAQFNACEVGNNANFFENTGASHCYLTATSTNFETHSGAWLAKTNGGSLQFRGCNFMMSNSAIEVIRTVGSGVTSIKVDGCSVSGITTGSMFATDGSFQAFESSSSANIRVYTDNTFTSVASNGNALKYRAIYKVTGSDVSVTAGENAVKFNEVVSANVSGLYNTTTGIFAPGKTGYFEIRTSMNLTSGTAANVYIRKNGSSVQSAGYTGRIASMPNGSTVAGSCLIYVGSATDTFDVVLTVSSNTSIRCASYHNECFVNIVEL